MASWILGLALGVLAAVLAVAYLWLVRRPETENAAGLRAVADLRWREFATIVGQACSSAACATRCRATSTAPSR